MQLGSHANITYKQYKECKGKITPLESELYYLSPEVVAGAPYTQEADVWGLGILLYEMATLVAKPEYLPSGKMLGRVAQVMPVDHR